MSLSDDEDDTTVCPLCVEELDLSDKNFLPCPCGYRVCMWCWHHIRENLNGLCPACRTPYNADPHAFSAVDRQEIVKKNRERKQKEKQERKQDSPRTTGATQGPNNVGVPGAAAAAAAATAAEIAALANQSNSSNNGPSGAAGGSSSTGTVSSKSSQPIERRHLHNYRVIQRNLVYIIGIPVTLANEYTLRKPKYLGQYGKLGKIVIHRNHGSPNPTVSVYVTFVHKEDAKASIQSLEGFWLEGRVLRASFGTTKYCNNFIRGIPCSNPDCVYLHDMGDDEDRFTKEEIQAGNSKLLPVPRHNQTIVTGMGGPSGTGQRPLTDPVFPPPVFLQDIAPSRPGGAAAASGGGNGTQMTRSSSGNGSFGADSPHESPALHGVQQSGHSDRTAPPELRLPSGTNGADGDGNGNGNGSGSNSGSSGGSHIPFTMASVVMGAGRGAANGMPAPQPASSNSNNSSSSSAANPASILASPHSFPSLPSATSNAASSAGNASSQRATASTAGNNLSRSNTSDSKHHDKQPPEEAKYGNAGPPPPSSSSSSSSSNNNNNNAASLKPTTSNPTFTPSDATTTTPSAAAAAAAVQQPQQRRMESTYPATSFNGIGKSAVFPVPISSLQVSIWANIITPNQTGKLDINPFGRLDLPLSELLDLTLPPVDAVCMTPWPKPLHYYRQGVGPDGNCHAPASRHIHKYTVPEQFGMESISPSTSNSLPTNGAGNGHAATGGGNGSSTVGPISGSVSGPIVGNNSISGPISGPLNSSMGPGLQHDMFFRQQQQQQQQQQQILLMQQQQQQQQGMQPNFPLQMPTDPRLSNPNPPPPPNPNPTQNPNLLALQSMFPGVKMTMGGPPGDK